MRNCLNKGEIKLHNDVKRKIGTSNGERISWMKRFNKKIAQFHFRIYARSKNIICCSENEPPSSFFDHWKEFAHPIEKGFKIFKNYLNTNGPVEENMIICLIKSYYMM